MEANGKIIRILLVDDIPEFREYLAHLLHGEEFIEVVGMSSNGKEAVKDYEFLLPDIMITCICMPEMDGIEATSIIVKNHPNAQIIINSVQSDPDYLKRAILAGAKYIISKPVSKDELMETIDSIIKNNHWVIRYTNESQRNNNPLLQPKPDPYTIINIHESNKQINPDQILSKALLYSNKQNGGINNKKQITSKPPKKRDHPSYVRLYHGPLVKWSTYLRIQKSNHDWDMAALTLVIIIIIVIIVSSIFK